jgi:nucleotide-binding universal stress UspA family protein
MSDPTTPPVFAQVMLAADLTDGSEPAWTHALRLCIDTRGALSVVHTRCALTDAAWTDVPTVRDLLQRWSLVSDVDPLADLRRLGLQVHLRALEAIDPRSRLPAVLREEQPDLLVVGTHRPTGLARFLHGSVGESLARAAPHAALVIPDGVRPFVDPQSGEVRLRTVLVPIGTGPDQQRAIDNAARLARSVGATDATFVLLHAGDPEHLPALDLPQEVDWQWRWQIHPPGAVVSRILDAAADADAVCMLTHGLDSVLDLIAGSRTDQVIRGATCPVLVVPSPR